MIGGLFWTLAGALCKACLDILSGRFMGKTAEVISMMATGVASMLAVIGILVTYKKAENVKVRGRRILFGIHAGIWAMGYLLSGFTIPVAIAAGMLYGVLKFRGFDLLGMAKSSILGAVDGTEPEGYFRRRQQFGKKVRKPFEALKRVDRWVDSRLTIGSLSLWSSPLPDLVSEIIKEAALRWPGRDREPYCKNTAQKRKAMLMVTAVVILGRILCHKAPGLLGLLNGLPFLDMVGFVEDSGGRGGWLSFIYLALWSGGLSAAVLCLLRKYIVGTEGLKLFSLDGICSWLMEVYICASCTDICYPVALWFAENYSPKEENPMAFILALMAVMLLVVMFSENFKNILVIVFSRQAFKLFCFLKLHLIPLFIMYGINEVTHMEIFRDTIPIACLFAVLFMQMLLELLEWSGLLERPMKFMKSMLSMRGYFVIQMMDLVYVLCRIPVLLIIRAWSA